MPINFRASQGVTVDNATGKVSVRSLAITNPTTTASATVGGASALPGVPAGYVVIEITGTNFKFPYWNI